MGQSSRAPRQTQPAPALPPRLHDLVDRFARTPRRLRTRVSMKHAPLPRYPAPAGESRTPTGRTRRSRGPGAAAAPASGLRTQRRRLRAALPPAGAAIRAAPAVGTEGGALLGPPCTSDSACSTCRPRRGPRCSRDSRLGAPLPVTSSTARRAPVPTGWRRRHRGVSSVPRKGPPTSRPCTRCSGTGEPSRYAASERDREREGPIPDAHADRAPARELAHPRDGSPGRTQGTGRGGPSPRRADSHSRP